MNDYYVGQVLDNSDIVVGQLDGEWLAIAPADKRVFGCNWAQAKEYCERLAYRLPSIEELDLVHQNSDLVNEQKLGGSLANISRCAYPKAWSSSKDEDGRFALRFCFASGQNWISAPCQNSNLWTIPIRSLTTSKIKVCTCSGHDLLHFGCKCGWKDNRGTKN